MAERRTVFDTGSVDETNTTDPFHSLDPSTLNTDVSIGMYYPEAGARHASGVSVYVRKIMEELSDSCEAYLYTQRTEETAEPDTTNFQTISIDTPLGRFGEHVSIGPSDLPPRLATPTRSMALFTSAFANGTIEHIDRNVDVLFTHGQIDTLLFSRLTSVPVVRTFHACQNPDHLTKYLTYLSNPAASIANSRQTALEVSEHLDHSVDRIVYPGVDTDVFTPDVEPAFDCDDVAITFVGRFTPKKGLFDLLEAFVDVQEHAQLRLIGRGDTERVRRRVAQLGIGESVTIDAPVPHADLPHYYVATDIMCLPTHYESFGLVNLEAMACGAAVVTSDVPGVTEYSIDGETALLVPPGNQDRLVAALRSLVHDPDLRTRIGENGRDVAKQYTWRASATQLVSAAIDVDDEYSPER